jgi:hypothetical protein
VAAVEIDKRQLVELLVVRGDVARAEQVDDTLPERVDLRAHAAQLRRLGIDAGLLATQIDNLEA